MNNLSKSGFLKLTSLTVLLTTTTFIAVPKSQAVVIRDDSSTGDLAYRQWADTFPSVGKLSLIFPETFNSTTGTGSINCSGTLIDPSWVLTAAHCLDAGKKAGSTTEVGGFFTFGYNSNQYNAISSPQYSGLNSVRIVGAIQNSSWVLTNGNTYVGNDIALLKLDSPINNLSPAPLYTGLFPIIGTPGVTGSSVGFGLSGTGLTGQVIGTGQVKRAGQTSVNIEPALKGLNCNCSQSLLSSLFQNPKVNPNQSILNYSLGKGDSGGGLFINGKLAGINSFIDSLTGGYNSKYGTTSYYTDVLKFKDWINNVEKDFLDSSPVSTIPSSLTPIKTYVIDRTGGLILNTDGSDVFGDVSQSINDISIYNISPDIYSMTAPNATSVPEPFTIIGTLIGGTTAFKMRKKLKAMAKPA